MAKSGILAPYKFQGKNLNATQKAYNKSVDKAWRRIKYMNKRYGIKATLPELPATTYTKEIEKATERIEAIRTDVYLKPEKYTDYVKQFIEGFITDISDYVSSVDVSSVYTSTWEWNKDRAEKFKNYMVNAVNKEINSMGEVAFYANIIKTGKATRLKEIAQMIYSLPYDDKIYSNATGLFNQFLDELRGSPLTITEFSAIQEFDKPEDEYSAYNDMLDRDTFVERINRDIVGNEYNDLLE